jgi:hypothetical protein
MNESEGSTYAIMQVYTLNSQSRMYQYKERMQTDSCRRAQVQVRPYLEPLGEVENSKQTTSFKDSINN